MSKKVPLTRQCKECKEYKPLNQFQTEHSGNGRIWRHKSCIVCNPPRKKHYSKAELEGMLLAALETLDEYYPELMTDEQKEWYGRQRQREIDKKVSKSDVGYADLVVRELVEGDCYGDGSNEGESGSEG